MKIEEAVARLKEAVAGKKAVDRKHTDPGTGATVHTASHVEVQPLDVLAVCKSIAQQTKRVAALELGVHDAHEESPSVYVKVADALHLLEQFETAPVG